ncbi:MAG: hypothetical protein WCG75_10640 [Armatimonadota bacterium]
MRQRKRAMIMIFVVIMIAAATTIIAASVDLGRMAAYKQKQSEREAKWDYCVESAKSLVVENLTSYGSTTQSFAQTVNGMSLAISAVPAPTWNPTTSTRITVTGTLDGQSRTSAVLVGKRTYVNPFLFAMYFTSIFNPNDVVKLDDDLFLPSIYDVSNTKLTGDCYSTQSTAPAFNSFSGTFYGRQPVEPFYLDDAAYAAAASITTSGASTLNNPTNLISITHSQLRYHTGNLVISGTVTGEITIFVKGGAYMNKVKFANALSRLVVICDGDINFEAGDCDAFIMGNGKCRMSGVNGDRKISGSVAANELTATNNFWKITYDNYFALNSDGAFRYWLPGAW